MANTNKKALIIGCGLGGPALALFLKRAGIEAEIYEARETSEGYALSLSCNGVAVLTELGLASKVFAEGSAVTHFLMQNGKGKALGQGELAGNGLQSIFIKRVPLGNILANEAQRQEIKIVRGKKLQRIEETSSEVIATFQDGTTAHADILIGCDGAHSRTRQLIDPTFAGPVYTGLVNSGGYTPNVKLSTPTGAVQFIFGKRAFFGYHVSPTGYTYWFTNKPQKHEPTRGESEKITAQERKAQLLELFQDDQALISDIISSAEETFPYFLSYALPQQPEHWHKGRVALLGDAAHAISPSSGQGASMALEDAIVLAKCLRDIPDYGQAFAMYQQLRYERTHQMYEVGERSDAGKHIVKPLQQWFRDLTTPFFLKLFVNAAATEWMYAYRVNWQEPVKTVPDLVQV